MGSGRSLRDGCQYDAFQKWAHRRFARATSVSPVPSVVKPSPLLQLSAQILDHLPYGLLIPPIPPPLPLLGRLYQTRFRENRHVMRDRGLRQMNARLDVAPAKASRFWLCVLAFLQNQQNPPARGVGDSVKRTIERCVRRHTLQINRKLMSVNLRDSLICGNLPGAIGVKTNTPWNSLQEPELPRFCRRLRVSPSPQSWPSPRLLLPSTIRRSRVCLALHYNKFLPYPSRAY